MSEKKLSEKILNTQTNACMRSLDFLIKESLINNRPADKVISYFFRKNKQLGSRDRRIILEVCYSTLRWWKWLELIIPENNRRILKKIEDKRKDFDDEYLFSFTVYLKIILSAILLDELDSNIKELFSHWIIKLKLKQEAVDKISRINNITEKGEFIISVFTATDTSNFRISDVIPDWIQDELACSIDVNKIAEICQKRPPMWLRNQHNNVDELIEALKKQNLHAVKHEKIKNALCIENPKVNLYSLTEFNKGWFEVQDLASQIIGLACKPKPGEWWWDSCAGAGGKTLQLSAQMKNKGRIAASDIREYKLDDLKKRARRAKLSNISYFAWNGKKLSTKKQNRYDGVLVDAPCTCSGTWRRNPDAKLKITRKEISEMSELQLKILNNASSGVKPNGVLIYATCSMFEKENNGVIKKFLKNNPDFSLEPFKNPLTGKMTDGTLNIYPWNGNCDAMFVTKLRKNRLI